MAQQATGRAHAVGKRNVVALEKMKVVWAMRCAFKKVLGVQNAVPWRCPRPIPMHTVIAGKQRVLNSA